MIAFKCTTVDDNNAYSEPSGGVALICHWQACSSVCSLHVPHSAPCNTPTADVEPKAGAPAHASACIISTGATLFSQCRVPQEMHSVKAARPSIGYASLLPSGADSTTFCNLSRQSRMKRTPALQLMLLQLCCVSLLVVTLLCMGCCSVSVLPTATLLPPGWSKRCGATAWSWPRSTALFTAPTGGLLRLCPQPYLPSTASLVACVRHCSLMCSRWGQLRLLCNQRQ